jgi:hypothetical protein
MTAANQTMLANTSLPKFAPKLYRHMSLNELVMYAVYTLAETKREINSEDIVAACFLLFPERFHLPGYPQWPDSTVVNKRWLDCRNRGYITGSTAHGFSLTPEGLQVAERTANALTGKHRYFSRRRPSKLAGEGAHACGPIRSVSRSIGCLPAVSERGGAR